MKLYTDTAEIDNLIIHYVGNPQREEVIEYSNLTVDIEDEQINDLLKHYFLHAFKDKPFQKFTHPSDLSFNEVYRFARQMFFNKADFISNSKHIARHLFDSTEHPQILAGELYITYFKGMLLDDEEFDAIGIFKSENKESFIKVFNQNKTFQVAAEQGINIHKLDKGCLIINNNADDGYRVIVVDNINKSGEAKFWKDEFLKVAPFEDEYFQTHQYLNLCKSFCKEVLTPQNDVSKIDQLAVQDRSIKFFKEKNNFRVEDFQEEVMQVPEVIDAFKKYKVEYEEKEEIQIPDEFEISEVATNKNKKFFKSIIKLDKNFHIYVHGAHDRMEKGIDKDKGMSYYKLFFEKEL